MILPIYSYGNPILKKKTLSVDKNYKNLNLLISDMFDTMYAASGVGLAAPQIGLSIRLFIVDCSSFKELDSKAANFKKIFINPRIIFEEGENELFEEGCLSIPNIRENVSRKNIIKIEYDDENFKKKNETYDGILARVIQHEYDHLEGTLFIDRLKQIQKTLIKRKLRDIFNGKISTTYKMKFFKKFKKI